MKKEEAINTAIQGLNQERLGLIKELEQCNKYYNRTPIFDRLREIDSFVRELLNLN